MSDVQRSYMLALNDVEAVYRYGHMMEAARNLGRTARIIVITSTSDLRERARLAKEFREAHAERVVCVATVDAMIAPLRLGPVGLVLAYDVPASYDQDLLLQAILRADNAPELPYDAFGGVSRELYRIITGVGRAPVARERSH